MFLTQIAKKLTLVLVVFLLITMTNIKIVIRIVCITNKFTIAFVTNKSIVNLKFLILNTNFYLSFIITKIFPSLEYIL